MSLSYEQLRSAVEEGAVGVRSRIELEPFGGPGDKVFPPTYDVDNNTATRYAVEERTRPATRPEDPPSVVRSVVLDSVASQANRFELALLDAVRAGLLSAPVTSVDFAGENLFGLDRISDYEAPHRIFDALLRDSFDGQALFRHGAVGQAITEANHRNASALLHHSPHTLVFGGWDSTGPRGGRGAKYERALTSEIVADGVQPGVKTSSRIDPVGIEKSAATIYKTDDDLRWTLDSGDAVQEKGKAQPYPAKQGEAGRPSAVNHGNITPSIDSRAGGVTAERIVNTTILSFIQLRRLRFPTDVSGDPIPTEQRQSAEIAARTSLAALGLAAAVLANEQGFDLRSRCVLVPQGPLRFELVGRAGSGETVELDSSSALELVAEAAEQTERVGLAWRSNELLLQPSPRLVELIRRSQEVAARGESDDS